MNSIIIKENKKFGFGIIKKENREYNNKAVSVYRIPSESDFTRKRLLKMLNKDRIFNIAFERGINEDFINSFKGKINIFRKEEVLYDNLDKIILKAASSLGIKDGKLKLGLVPEDGDTKLIQKAVNVRSKLKLLNIYSENCNDYEECADEFFKSTGISVVLKDDFKKIDCDILVYMKDKGMNLYGFNGQLIDIREKLDRKGIRDVKVNFDGFKNEFELSDCVLNKLLNNQFRADAFITK